MNTILVATDFSDNAYWGTDYALELARQLHAHLIVLHAYDPLLTQLWLQTGWPQRPLISMNRQ